MTGVLEKNIASVSRAIEHTVASERWCREHGIVQKIDPRIKIVSLVAILLACSLTHSIPALLCLYAASTVLAVASKIPVGYFTARVWIFVPLFTAVIAVPALFLTPGTPVATVGRFTITHEGMRTAAMLLLRVSASVSYSILLVLTTTWNSILGTLRELRLPGIAVTVLALSYRYLVLLLRTLSELLLARKSRVIAAPSFVREAAFASRSGGYLFLKSLHLAEGVHLALVSRGWNDEEARWSHAARACLDARNTAGDFVFELDDVRYSYPGGVAGLSIDRLSIPRGRCTVILGPNGSGKSTLLKVLDGLVYPQTGSARAFGTKLSERNLEDGAFREFFRGKVGLVFQDADVQCFSSTVREELAFGPRQMGMDESEVGRRVDSTLAALGISALADRYPYGLSGGEKKRVALASILTMDLDVYLLDEPTANLDPSTEGVLIDILSDLAGRGRTIVIATQDLLLARHIGDIVVVLGGEKRPFFVGPADEALDDTSLLERAGLVHAHKRPHRLATAGVRHTHYREERES
jgi:cobalt ECF transporter T component CbiQ